MRRNNLGPDAVGDAIDDFGAVLRRIDMDAERPCAEGHADDIDDGLGDCAGIGVGRFECCQALQAPARGTPL